MSSPPTFCHDLPHAFLVIEQLCEYPTTDPASHPLVQLCRTAQVLEVTFCERDMQLYFEGLILADHHGDAFDRNLTTERQEMELRD
jgi:hypothetical protein